MLTFALCLSAFFVGIFLMMWFFFGIVKKVFQSMGNGFSLLVESWTSENSEPQIKRKPVEITEIDLSLMVNLLSFALKFVISSMEEFFIKFDEYEADLLKKKDADQAFVKPGKNAKNSAGTHKEPLQEPSDNQGVPINDELIDDSQKSPSDIWKTTL